jgi:hypothetical protein
MMTAVSLVMTLRPMSSAQNANSAYLTDLVLVNISTNEQMSLSRSKTKHMISVTNKADQSKSLTQTMDLGHTMKTASLAMMQNRISLAQRDSSGSLMAQALDHTARSAAIVSSNHQLSNQASKTKAGFRKSSIQTTTLVLTLKGLYLMILRIFRSAYGENSIFLNPLDQATTHPTEQWYNRHQDQ